GAGPAGGSRAGILYQPVGKVATMATSARERILTAAKTLAESHDSVQGVTISLESVALQAGITKPGLMYHFPSQEALMLGLVDQAAEHWSWLLRNHTGRASEELSSFDRTERMSPWRPLPKSLAPTTGSSPTRSTTRSSPSR